MFVVVPVLAMAAIGLWLWQRARYWRLRENALRDLLDGADALEAQLEDYKSRMQRLRAMLTKLPSDMTAPAMTSIDPDVQVKNAKRDILAHRLWIQRESGNATQKSLDEAVAALRKSRVQLEDQLKLLDEVAAELEQAGQGLKSAYKEASAALAAVPKGEPPRPPRLNGHGSN
ncbi:MAG TPA: hypothetical protein VFL14_13490 [Xanthomonadales bacterium]|nr:hypothetical protein [Xanthomonadales bacterium]